MVVLDESDLPVVFRQAEAAAGREEALANEIAAGTSLTEAFAIESFLARRRTDADADFGAHLARLERAI